MIKVVGPGMSRNGIQVTADPENSDYDAMIMMTRMREAEPGLVDGPEPLGGCHGAAVGRDQADLLA